MTRPNGLTNRIAAFYRRNPEEWLSYADMAVKFDCTAEQAQAACNYLQAFNGFRREAMHIVRMVRQEAEG